MAHEFTMSAKYEGKCAECGYKIAVGTWIIYDPTTKKARHKICPQPDPNEQRNIFEMWVKRVQELEGKIE